MLNQIVNPTRAQFVSLIDRSQDETVRGVVSTSDGTVVICDGGARIHKQLADENGIGDYLAFTVEKGWDDDHDYRFDFPAAFTMVRFLRSFRVNLATVGIVQLERSA